MEMEQYYYEAMDDDILAKFDYEHEYGSKRNLNEYQQLWLEVLKQAIYDYCNLWPKRNQQIADFKEIYDWFFKDQTFDEGSFNYICLALDITKFQIMRPLVEYSKRHV